MDIIKKNKYTFLLVFITLIAGITYSKGLSGPFLYDDYKSLSRLGLNGGINTYQDALSFITSNTSGPLGRQVSIASFLIDGQTWPTSPYQFKLTNLFIHLLCGWIIFLFIQKVTISIGDEVIQKNARAIASLTASLWLLHPLHVSTTLYIVQRMSQLSTVFSLLSIILFLHYRPLLIQQNRILGFFKPSIILFLLISLAVYSKENAILVFPALLLINYFCAKQQSTLYFKIWFYGLTIIPIIISLGVLLVNMEGHAMTYEYKGFTLIQRLLTQVSVVTDYILQILWPDINTMSIFHDDIEISSSFTSFPTYLFSLFLISLSLLIFININPIYRFSIAWFFIWHLIESSGLPLAMYFEHRNYIASIGPVFAITFGIIQFSEKYFTRFNWSAINSIFTIIAIFLGIQLSILTTIWADEESLYMHWFSNHQKSRGSLITLLHFYEKNGDIELSHKITKLALKESHYQDDLSILFIAYNQECILNSNTDHTLDKLEDLSIRPTSYSLSTLSIYTLIISNIRSGLCVPNESKNLHTIFNNMERYAPQKNHPNWLSKVQSEHALLYIHENKLISALNLLTKSYKSNHPNIAIAIIDLNIQLSKLEEAQQWINKARQTQKAYQKTRYSIEDTSPRLNILQERLDNLKNVR